MVAAARPSDGDAAVDVGESILNGTSQQGELLTGVETGS
jgi:hypothetical protein